MAKSSTKDEYANKFYGTVTETAANTLTFAEIQTSINMFDKTAWIIHRLEWYMPQATIDLMVADADGFYFALCARNNIASLAVTDMGDAGIIDIGRIVFKVGAAGTTWIHQPQIRDFSGLPGGGIIVAPRPLYVGLQGTSVATAGTMRCRGYFTHLELTADRYLELVDFYRIVQ